MIHSPIELGIYALYRKFQGTVAHLHPPNRPVDARSLGPRTPVDRVRGRQSDVSPKFHPFKSRVLRSIALIPNFGAPEVRVFRLLLYNTKTLITAATGTLTMAQQYKIAYKNALSN